MTFGYYPGCALHGSSNDYEASVRACLDRLGVGLKEIDDWICCGASAAHSINHDLSLALPARNLALAGAQGLNEVLAPCPLCSMALIKARQVTGEDPELCRRISSIVELPVRNGTGVLNLIQVLDEIGLDRIRQAAVKPLEGISAACYYGCLLTRVPEPLQFDDCEQPRSMETILEALGARTVPWNFATECCGAGLTMANEDTVLELSHRILSDAGAKGANCVVVACPMCHVNLDMKQSDVERRYAVRHDMPVYYLSDLVGLAMGLSEQVLGIDRHFVHRS